MQTDEDRDAGRPATGAANAYVLRRVFPPTAELGTSFLGGLPRLPADLAWPTTRDGTGLTFLGQVDLDTLPDAPCRDLLPGGALLFFADTGEELTAMGEPGGAAVVHVPAGIAAVPPRAPPPHVTPLYEGEAAFHLPWLRHDPAPGAEAPRSFPCWPVAAAPLRTTPDEADEEASHLRAAYEAAFGPPPLWEHPTWWTEQDRARLGPFHPLPLAQDDRLWLPGEDWPQGWIHIEIFAARLLEDLRMIRRRAEAAIKAGRGEVGPWRRQLAGYAAAAQAAEGWHARAGRASAFAAVPTAERAAFRAWVEGLGAMPPASPLRRLAAALGLAPRTETLPELGPKRLNRVTETAFIAGADAWLGYAPEAALAGLPPALLPLLAGRHAPLATRRHGEGLLVRHQLLGHGRDVQGAPGAMGGTHVLLMQFDTDAGMFWMWGDVGVVQFWITPADLDAGRFDRCVATMEGH